MTYAAPGIAVTLADAANPGPILSGDAIIVAEEGAFGDTARFAIQPSNYNVGIGLAYERTGIYRVEVIVTDYEPWSMDGIRVVNEDRCHVRTRGLTAHLSPIAH